MLWFVTVATNHVISIIVTITTSNPYHHCNLYLDSQCYYRDNYDCCCRLSRLSPLLFIHTSACQHQVPAGCIQPQIIVFTLVCSGPKDDWVCNALHSDRFLQYHVTWRPECFSATYCGTRNSAACTYWSPHSLLGSRVVMCAAWT